MFDNPIASPNNNQPLGIDWVHKTIEEEKAKLAQSNPLTRFLVDFTGQKAIEEFQKTEVVLDNLQNISRQIYETLEQIKSAPSPLSIPPPQLEGLSKEEALALAIGALFNFKAAGLAALGVKKQKEEKYLRETERYKMLTEMALQDYNLRYNRAASALSQLTQAAGATAQKQLNFLTAIQTFYPQLERLVQEQEREAFRRAFSLFELQVESDIKRNAQLDESLNRWFQTLSGFVQWALEKGLTTTAEEAAQVFYKYLENKILPAIIDNVEPQQIMSITNEEWGKIYDEIRRTGQMNIELQRLRVAKEQAQLDRLEAQTSLAEIQARLAETRIKEVEARVQKLLADTELSKIRGQLLRAQTALTALRTAKLNEGKLENSSQVANALAIAAQLRLTANALREQANELQAQNPNDRRIATLRSMADELERDGNTINRYVLMRTQGQASAPPRPTTQTPVPTLGIRDPNNPNAPRTTPNPSPQNPRPSRGGTGVIIPRTNQGD